jgi:A/G-specific adenine glycosylase
MGDASSKMADATWFQQQVLIWSSTHGRVFPWRSQRDPYAILIAEMMLHRTQARQVEDVYPRFLELYPDAPALARADEAAVRSIVAPLGLGWRLANFIPLARAVVERHSGQVPRDRQALLRLPGVGPYVADAVRVFAFDELAALVDTNTVRVAGRYFGFATHAESRRQRSVQDAVAALIELSNPRKANLAVLDLAAIVCRARDPVCSRCPVAERCDYARRARSQPPARVHELDTGPSATVLPD